MAGELAGYIKLIKTPKTAIIVLLGISASIYHCYFSELKTKLDEKAIALVLPASLAAAFLFTIVVEKLFVTSKKVVLWSYSKFTIFMIELSRKRRIKKQVSKKVNELNELENRFLELFFDSIEPVGTSESKEDMTPDLYSAGVDLAKAGVLTICKTDNKEHFEVTPQVRRKVSKSVFQKPYARNSLDLDPRYIIASYGSGGGATGSNSKLR